MASSNGGGGIAILVIAMILGLGIYTGNIDLDNLGDPPVIGNLDAAMAAPPSSAPSSSLPFTGGHLAAAVPAAGSGNLANGLTFSPNRATDTLAVLQITPETSMAGYSREQFPHWRNADNFGWSTPNDNCSTREASLVRDGTNVKVSASCSITSGTWTDPYTGTVTTNAGDLDIDHMVPLAEAWRTGANLWTIEQRTKFANDPRVAVAVGASPNREKGDRGPEDWKPASEASWCAYSVRWIEVKSAYTLTVTDTEKTALSSMLATCPPA